MEHPVGAVTVDHRRQCPRAVDGEIRGDIEVTRGGGVFVGAEDGERVGAGRQRNRVGTVACGARVDCRVGVGGKYRFAQ